MSQASFVVAGLGIGKSRLSHGRSTGSMGQRIDQLLILVGGA